MTHQERRPIQWFSTFFMLVGNRDVQPTHCFRNRTCWSVRSARNCAQNTSMSTATHPKQHDSFVTTAKIEHYITSWWKRKRSIQRILLQISQLGRLSPSRMMMSGEELPSSRRRNSISATRWFCKGLWRWSAIGWTRRQQHNQHAPRINPLQGAMKSRLTTGIMTTKEENSKHDSYRCLPRRMANVIYLRQQKQDRVLLNLSSNITKQKRIRNEWDKGQGSVRFCPYNPICFEVFERLESGNIIVLIFFGFLTVNHHFWDY